jgi:hypothetical protein
MWFVCVRGCGEKGTASRARQTQAGAGTGVWAAAARTCKGGGHFIHLGAPAPAPSATRIRREEATGRGSRAAAHAAACVLLMPVVPPAATHGGEVSVLLHRLVHVPLAGLENLDVARPNLLLVPPQGRRQALGAAHLHVGFAGGAAVGGACEDDARFSPNRVHSLQELQHVLRRGIEGQAAQAHDVAQQGGHGRGVALAAAPRRLRQQVGLARHKQPAAAARSVAGAIFGSFIGQRTRSRAAGGPRGPEV